MASGGAFTVKITAVDAATAKINAINKSLAGMQAPIKSLGASLSKFGNLTGISKGFELISKSINSMVSGLLKIVPALGIITGGGIVAALAGQVRTWSEYAAHLKTTSQWLGLMPSQLQNLQNATRMLGGSAQEATQAYEALDDALQDAVGGRNPELFRLAKLMGVNIQDVGLKAKSAADVMPQLMDRIKELNDTGRLTPAIMRSLAQSWHLTPEMLRAATKGGWAEFQRLQAEAAKSGLDSKQINVLDDLYQKTMGLTEAVEGFGAKLAAALAPFLGPQMDKLKEWFQNPENIKTTCEAILGVVNQITKLATEINSFVEATTGWKTALEILGTVLLIKFLAPLIQIAAQVTSLAAGIRSCTAAAEAASKVSGAAGVAGAAGGAAGVAGTLGLVGAAGKSIPVIGQAIAVAEGLKILADVLEKKFHFTPEGGAEDKGWEDVVGTRKWFGKKWRQWTGQGEGGGGGAAPNAGGSGGGGGKGAPEPAVPYQPGSITGEMGVTPEQYNAMKESVAGIEGARYDQMGGSSGRFAGRYQMGGDEIRETANRLGEKPPSREEFLKDPAMQERYFEAYTAGHHKTLMATSAEYRNASPEERLKILAYAHNQGPGGAANWLRTGQQGRDAFGTSGKKYYDRTGAALAQADKGNKVADNTVQPKWYKGSQTTTVEGGIKIDINNNTQNSVTASSSGGLLGAPRVMQPMGGYA